MLVVRHFFLLAGTLAQVTPQPGAEPLGSPNPQTDALLGFFQGGTFYLAAIIEAGAAVIIGLAAMQAIFISLMLFARRDANQQTKEDVRLNLGRWLAVALEFELAADILRTAVAPTWSQIGQLAAIIVIRTAVNYFLQQEIDKAAQRGSKLQTAANPASQGLPADETHPPLHGLLKR